VLVLAAICALGLMFSTLTARPVASAVLTYLTIGALVFGTVIGFGLGAFLVSGQERQQVFGVPDTWWETHQPPVVDPSDPTLTQEQIDAINRGVRPTRSDCVRFTRETEVSHTERIWWLLPLNPFVVVADAAPSELRRENGQYAGGFTPMRWISIGARTARNGPDAVADECAAQTAVDDQAQSAEVDRALQTAPVWPWGLGFLLVVGGAATWVAARRLRTPIRRLPNGTRIA
jgi:hypothetical protein